MLTKMCAVARAAKKAHAQVHHAFYSEQAAHTYGYFTYSDMYLGTIMVTAIYPTLSEATKYKWSDKVYVGPIHLSKKSHR